MQKPKRPVFLQLWLIRLPMPAILSILHRISGVLMTISVPLMAYYFYISVHTEVGYLHTRDIFSSYVLRILLAQMIWCVLHHLLAGVRHLFLDVGLGMERKVARVTAIFSTISAVVLLVLVLIAGGMFS